MAETIKARGPYDLKGRTFLYRIHCRTTGKEYYGICKDPKRRWSAHRVAARLDHGAKLYIAMRSEGEDNFSFELLGEFPTRIEALRAEEKIVRESGSVANGYNQIPGGNSMAHMTIAGERRSEIAKKMHANRDPAVKAATLEKLRNGYSRLTAEERTANSKRANALIPREGRVKGGAAAIAARSEEQKAAILAKLQAGRDAAHKRKSKQERIDITARGRAALREAWAKFTPEDFDRMREKKRATRRARLELQQRSAAIA